jgi:hypothetical protein
MKILYLDDRKVLRRFGKRPDLGRIIGGASPTKKVQVSSPCWVVDNVYPPKRKMGIHAGQRGSSIVKGHWEDVTTVTVRCTVALRCVGKGKWQALCQESHRTYVEWWLTNHCGQHPADYSY